MFTKPLPFVCMDGWFPYVIPVASSTRNSAKATHDCTLTHGDTSMRYFEDIHEVGKAPSWGLTGEMVGQRKARDPAESELRQLWPNFSSRFVYRDKFKRIIVKPKCPSELDSGFICEDNNIIHLFSEWSPTSLMFLMRSWFSCRRTELWVHAWLPRLVASLCPANLSYRSFEVVDPRHL